MADEVDLGELSCADFVELVTEYLEGSLPTADRERFAHHLRVCTPCEQYMQQIRAVVQRAGRLREEDLTADARETLLGAFRDWRRRGRTSS